MAAGGCVWGGPGRRTRGKNYGRGSGNVAQQMTEAPRFVRTGEVGTERWPRAARFSGKGELLMRAMTKRQMKATRRPWPRDLTPESV